MENETPKSQPPSAPSTPPSPDTTAAPANLPAPATPPAPASPKPPVEKPPTATPEVQTLLSEATKYTVLAGFVLYAIGFLIWHSYLSKYGVSSIGFLQPEYISAAFCYLSLLVIFAGISAVFYERYVAWYKGIPPYASYVTFKGFWYLFLWLGALFFPRPPAGPIDFIITLFLFLCMVGYIFGDLLVKESKMMQTLERSGGYMLILGIGVIIFITERKINLWFVSFTMLLYPFLSYVVPGRIHIGDAWILAKDNSLVGLLRATAIILMLVKHIGIFGAFVFGDIPRSVGGKPDSALIKLDSQHVDLISGLNLPTTNRSSNIFVGPVSILFKSEKELIFIEEAPKNITNVVTNVVTKVVADGTTSSQTTLTTNIVANRVRPNAKQIRADLIDAVEFLR